jgi:hypothetical protein
MNQDIKKPGLSQTNLPVNCSWRLFRSGWKLVCQGFNIFLLFYNGINPQFSYLYFGFKIYDGDNYFAPGRECNIFTWCRQRLNLFNKELQFPVL